MSDYVNSLDDPKGAELADQQDFGAGGASLGLSSRNQQRPHLVH
jgi:hypothetical protein